MAQPARALRGLVEALFPRSSVTLGLAESGLVNRDRPPAEEVDWARGAGLTEIAAPQRRINMMRLCAKI